MTGNVDAPGVPDPRRWFGLVFISIAVSLIIVDSTIVNVAMPAIIDELRITSTQVQWVQESYTLVFAALLILFGTLADRVGRKRLLCIGITVFVLSSVIAALAPAGDLLIAARVVQGIGGAMVLPTTLSLINATFRGSERAVAFAVWGATIGGMAALGPLVGGWLTTDFSWRLAFGINVPVGAVALAGGLWALTESREPRPGRVDTVGAVLSVITFGTLVFGLIEGRTLGWWASAAGTSAAWPFALSPIPLAFATALAAGAAFTVWSRKRQQAGRTSMLDFSLLAIPSFRNGNLAALVVSLGELGIVFTLPLWLQNVLGYTALSTGVLLVALACGSFLSSGFVRPLSRALSAVWVVRIGLILEAAGVLGMALVIGTDTPWWQMAPFLFGYGAGVGFATAQLTGVVLQDVPVALSGQASGTQSTARQVGSALGIAILGTVLFTATGSSLAARLSEARLPPSQAHEVTNLVVDSAGAVIPRMAEDPQTAPFAADAKIAFSDGTRVAAFSAAGFLALGFLSTLSLGGAAPTGREDGEAPAQEAVHAAPAAGLRSIERSSSSSSAGIDPGAAAPR